MCTDGDATADRQEGYADAEDSDGTAEGDRVQIGFEFLTSEDALARGQAWQFLRHHSAG